MKYSLKKTVVIGLGGSVIVPDVINGKLLKEWVALIRRYSKKYRFVIVVGGGRLARNYQNAARDVQQISSHESDWLGIYATRLNAQLVQTAFSDIADKQIIDSREKIKKIRKPVTVACGWEPGWSTDYIAGVLGDVYNSGVIIMAGKPAYIFDKNPDKYNNVKKIDHCSWKEYRKIIPKKWVPGANVPIDPVCARYCERQKISVIVVSGRDLKNIEQLLNGEDFKGTLVE